MGAKKKAMADRQRCVACGACVKECPRKAISVIRGCYAYADSTLCIGCGKCARICPAGCISMETVEVQP